MRFSSPTLVASFLSLSVLAGCAHHKTKTVETTTTTTTTTPPTTTDKPAPAVDISDSVKRIKATDTGFTVTEKIQFADNKADVLPASESLMQEVVTVLKDNPDLIQVYIAGYTSSEGNAKHNQKLSEDRAASVRTWLVAHGIDAGRLVTGGFGPASPIGDNTTEEGREKNRRVEFTALKYEVNGKIHENATPTAK